MGWRGTVVVIFVVAIVGGYLWIAEAPKPEAAETPANLLGEPRVRDPSKFVALLPFEPASVVGVHIVSGTTEMSAKRTGEGWDSPRPAAAINDFLRALSELGRIMEIATDDGALQDYGLAEPQAVVELTLRGREQPVTLDIGASNPATTGVYVRIDGTGPVILAGALLTWEIDKLFQPLTD